MNILFYFLDFSLWVSWHLLVCGPFLRVFVGDADGLFISPHLTGRGSLSTGQGLTVMVEAEDSDILLVTEFGAHISMVCGMVATGGG